MRFDPKDPGETVSLTFDFRDLLGPDTITASSLSVALLYGADSNSAALLTGVDVRAGNQVSHLVRAGVDGCAYLLACAVDTAGGQHYLARAILPVISQ